MPSTSFNYLHLKNQLLKYPSTIRHPNRLLIKILTKQSVEFYGYSPPLTVEYKPPQKLECTEGSNFSRATPTDEKEYNFGLESPQVANTHIVCTSVKYLVFSSKRIHLELSCYVLTVDEEAIKSVGFRDKIKIRRHLMKSHA